MSDWQPIETAPKDGSSFLVLQDPEVYRAGYTGDGRISWRTHKNRTSGHYRQIETELDGEPVTASVKLSESEAFCHDWTLWTRGFEFAPTHWAPLPRKPLTIHATGPQGFAARPKMEG